MLLHSLNQVVKGQVEKRPSKYCKTPYMADVLVDGEVGEVMAHSPSLGCCGLVDSGSHIIMTEHSGKKTKSTHRVELAYYYDEYRNRSVVIGVNPKLSEILVEKAMVSNCLRNLTQVRNYRREVKILNSRFDFAGKDEEGRDFVLEVKTVPLADYVDMSKKDKKKYVKEHKEELDAMDFDNKIAYFPDGYRKSGDAVVSPRALKHIQELEELVKTTEMRAILCFVVQREDVALFQTSNIDPTYKAAVKQAHENGVEIMVLQLRWTEEGHCYFVRNDLPISL